jgi:hypothetical protein
MMAENSVNKKDGADGTGPAQQETPQTEDSDSSRDSPDIESQNSRLYHAVNGHHYIGGSHWETVIQEVR